MDLKNDLGVGVDLSSAAERAATIKYLNLKFVSMGMAGFDSEDSDELKMTRTLFNAIRAKNGTGPAALPEADVQRRAQ